MKLSLSKSESLKNKQRIALLFKQGATVKQYPVLLKYTKGDQGEYDQRMHFLFSVPKRNMKKAVHRNTIKRRMREAVRLHKAELAKFCEEHNVHLDVAVIYMARDLEEFQHIQKSFVKAQQKLIEEIKRTLRN